MDAFSIQDQIATLVDSLQKIAKDARGESTKALRKGGDVLVRAIRPNVPVSKETHYRYDSKGTLVAQYNPGNLRDSIKVMKFRRAKYAVFVGPVASRDPVGVFGPDGGFSYEGGAIGKSSRVDGWYAHFVHYGDHGGAPRPFMRLGFDQSNSEVSKVVISALKKSIENTAEREYRKWAKKYAKIRGRT